MKLNSEPQQGLHISALEGRYSRAQLLLHGSTLALRDLSRILSSGNDVHFYLAADHNNTPHPYDGFLATGQIRCHDGQVRIFHNGDGFIISGPQPLLKIFAESIDILASTPASASTVAQHVHFDSTVLEFICNDSDELIVSKD